MQASCAGDLGVLGDWVAENRGADYVQYLVPVPWARARYLTGHRTPITQPLFARSADGAGKHLDYNFLGSLHNMKVVQG